VLILKFYLLSTDANTEESFLSNSTLLFNCYKHLGQNISGPKYICSIICLPFCQSYKKVVLRLSEHGERKQYCYICVICTITCISHKVCSPQSFLTNSVPATLLGKKYALVEETKQYFLVIVGISPTQRRDSNTTHYAAGLCKEQLRL